MYPAALSLLEQNLRACQNLEIFLTQVSEATLALSFFLFFLLFMFMFLFLLYCFFCLFVSKKLSIEIRGTEKVIGSFKLLEHLRILIVVSSNSFMLDFVAEVFHHYAVISKLMSSCS